MSNFWSTRPSRNDQTGAVSASGRALQVLVPAMSGATVLGSRERALPAKLFVNSCGPSYGIQ